MPYVLEAGQCLSTFLDTNGRRKPVDKSFQEHIFKVILDEWANGPFCDDSSGERFRLQSLSRSLGRVQPMIVPHMEKEMEEYADLHIHTTASDGTVTPEGSVELALQADLRAMAITDHDAVHGIAPALEAARGRGIEVVPGVELSVSVEGSDLHLLGYYIDYANEAFAERLRLFRQVREERAEKIVRKLNELGVPLSLERVKEIADEGAIGRPHVAEALIQQHVVSSMSEAFARFLGYDSPAYVPKFKISPKEGIEMIRSVHGIAVFAHPGTLRRDELIPGFVAQGLQGLEVVHPDHDDALVRHYTNLAQKYGLATTGGSDSHGPRKNLPTIGAVKIPWTWVEELKRLRVER